MQLSLLYHQSKSLQTTLQTDELLEGLRKADRKAQRAVYERYFSEMIAIPFKYVKTKADAQSILNEAFIKVFQSIHNYKPTGSFSGWVARIVFNTTIDHVRKQTKYEKYNSLQELPEVLITKSDALSNLGINEIYNHIQGLPENERTIFSLFALDGYKHKEISQLLDIPIGTSKWYLNNARKKLQDILKKEGYEQ